MREIKDNKNKQTTITFQTFRVSKQNNKKLNNIYSYAVYI